MSISASHAEWRREVVTRLTRVTHGGTAAIAAGLTLKRWAVRGAWRHKVGPHLGLVRVAARVLRWKAFENAAWIGLLLALGIAFAVTGGVEAVRWYLRRRASQPGPDG